MWCVWARLCGCRAGAVETGVASVRFVYIFPQHEVIGEYLSPADTVAVADCHSLATWRQPDIIALQVC